MLKDVVMLLTRFEFLLFFFLQKNLLWQNMIFKRFNFTLKQFSWSTYYSLYQQKVWNHHSTLLIWGIFKKSILLDIGFIIYSMVVNYKVCSNKFLTLTLAPHMKNYCCVLFKSKTIIVYFFYLLSDGVFIQRSSSRYN